MCNLSATRNKQTGGAVMAQRFKMVPRTRKASMRVGFCYRQRHCFGPSGTYGLLAKFEMGNIFVAAEPQPNRMASQSQHSFFVTHVYAAFSIALFGQEVF